MVINKRHCTFADIRIGHAFIFSDELYMKIDSIRVSDTKAYNAISLENGLIAEFNLCDKVKPCIISIEVAD